ncbi:MAG: hypothetical protein J0I29_13530 [Rhizobiales bacterium]|nr:hypothetical protein [Hyphomicrobiales bacterium]
MARPKHPRIPKSVIVRRLYVSAGSGSEVSDGAADEKPRRVSSDFIILKQCSDFLSIQLIGRVEMPALLDWKAAYTAKFAKISLQSGLYSYT